MPTYEYRCPKGHEFEMFQRMSEPPVAQCPACGQEATRLLSGGAGLLFKGQGFYITDYRSDSYKKAAASDSGGGESKGGESKGGESKGGETKGGETKGGESKSQSSGVESGGGGSGKGGKPDSGSSAKESG
jgi:putative FmdB family regulatory protein